MSFPKVVGLDTESVRIRPPSISLTKVIKSWTIWEGYLDHKNWGKGCKAHKDVEGNIERVDRHLLRDRT